MDGIEVLQKIKQDPETQNLKVVFVSAFGDARAVHSDVDMTKELGGTDFIRKGLDLDEFVKRVKECL